MLIILSILDDTPNEEKQNVSSESLEVEDYSEMERLRRYLAQKLRLVDLPANDESQQLVLHKLNLDGIVEYIKENTNCKIITMAGAGISTCEYIFKDIQGVQRNCPHDF